MAFVPKAVITAQEPFTIALPKEALTGASSNVTIQVSAMDGGPLPDWLKFDAPNRRFVVSVIPPKGLPLQIRVTVGQRRTVITVVEVER